MDSRSSRVLIVDDMLMNRVVLASLLSSHGIMSDQVESGRECLSLCEKKDYDLILLDHRMPEMDGVDTFLQLKKLMERKGKSIPVICHTTAEGRHNINLYKAAGFTDVLIKPIDPQELLEVMMHYLPKSTKQNKKTQRTPSELLPKNDKTHHEESLNDEVIKAEVEKLPMWLKLVPGINLVDGVVNCGGCVEDYIDALYIFYSSVEDKADELVRFMNDQDISMYSLRVHSIKSMARIIGARKLGDIAAMLEDASRAGDMDTVKRNTGEFVRFYRELGRHLAPVADEQGSISISEEKNTTVVDKESECAREDHSRTVLYIQNGGGLVKMGIENRLSESGFRIISVPDEPDRIIVHRREADIIVYAPRTDEHSHTCLTLNLLAEICQDDAKLLCLIGEADEIDKAMEASGAERVSRIYERPVDFGKFIKDMEFFAQLESDYHKKKTIFVVDDDAGYLSVARHWLSDEYHVSCFQVGEEALEGLHTVIPDMLLLDYEMPQMDGCMLIKSIRTDDLHQNIPIIFLTGRNDKEHVFNVLEYKPDGYLLKSSGKDALLDTLRRYFAETMFYASMSQSLMKCKKQ